MAEQDIMPDIGSTDDGVQRKRRLQFPKFLAAIAVNVILCLIASSANVPSPKIFLTEGQKIMYTSGSVKKNLTIADMRQHSVSRLLVQSKSIIPVWMKNYLEWHADQRLHPTNETKYLVVRCLRGDKCGGISDRFKPLPFYVMLANATNRVLLMHWDKPAALEEFLVPPDGGLDWRVKGTKVSLEEIQRNSRKFDGLGCADGAGRYVCWDPVSAILTYDHWKSQRALNILAKGGRVIASWNDIFLKSNRASNHDLMEDVFRLLFEPSPAVANAISHEMSTLGIVERSYVAVHVRAKAPTVVPEGIALGNFSAYANFQVDMKGGLIFEGKVKDFIVNVMTNAVNCAAQLAPGLPIYVVSDTTEAVQYMVNDASTPYTIVASNRTDDTLHVDFDGHGGRDPADFYHTFVDLFLMSKAKCTSHGVGGFGKLPIRIGGINCTFQHRREKRGDIIFCPGPNKNITR